MYSIPDVLRFDVTKEWVYHSWARKTTGLADPELFGVRVPLVTGTGPADIAGSLSYYFNAQDQVQHIKLFGRTADTTHLINFLARTYGFQRMAPVAGEQVYEVQRNGRAQSRLRIRPEAALWATLPQGSFAVELELERPGSNRYLPPPELPLPDVLAAATANQAPPEVAAAESGAASGKDESPSLLESVRPATPAEQRQINWHRWPD